MIVTLTKYRPDSHDFLALSSKGRPCTVDPFVSGAFPSTDDPAADIAFGHSCVGKRFEMSDDVLIYMPCYLPDQGQFTEVRP